MTLDTRLLCRVAGGRLVSGEHRPLGPVTLDSRSVEAGGTFFCIHGPRFDGHRFASAAIAAGARIIVAERRGVAALGNGVFDGPAAICVVPDTVRALGRISAAARARFTGDVIGLTGSSGKTTTKELLAAVLAVRGPVLATRGNLNNHLGVPLTLLRLEPTHRSAVIEMGMSASGEIDYLAALAGPQIGVITTVGAAHLASLGSIARVARAKGELFDALPPSGLAVMPSDIAYPWIVTAGLRAPLSLVGTQASDEIRLTRPRATRDGSEGTIIAGDERARLRLRIAGTHNLQNALLALAVGRALGVSLADGCAALAEVAAPPMRGELRHLRDGTEVVLDCYNANPQSMAAAVRTFADRAPGGLLVLGDMLELGASAEAAHRDIGELVAGLRGAPSLIAVGPLAATLARAARDAGLPAARVATAADADAAVLAVGERRAPGQPILLKGSRGVRLERVYEALAAEGD